MNKITIEELWDLSQTIVGEEIRQYRTPWGAIPHINEIIEKYISKLNLEEYEVVNNNVYIHKTCKINKTCSLTGPCIIGEGSELRQAAFIRGNVIVGKNCVIGNSCELKNSIVFNDAQIPHFNYVGDSIIGHKSHLGAGAITSNLKSDRSLVTIKNGDEKIETGLKKLGAIIGDDVEIGCNSVLNPGTVIGQGTTVYPLSFVRGFVKKNSIYKNLNEIVEKK